MLDSVQPFKLKFIQREKASSERDAFDYALVYCFYTERTASYQRLKYILRVETYKDVFAIKFYAGRDANWMISIIILLKHTITRMLYVFSLPAPQLFLHY